MAQHPSVQNHAHLTPLDERGSVMVEYVILLTLVSIVAATATVNLGPPLVRWYELQRVFILVGVP